MWGETYGTSAYDDTPNGYSAKRGGHGAVGEANPVRTIILPMLAATLLCVPGMPATAASRHHTRKGEPPRARSEATLQCPKLVEHDFLSRWGQPVEGSPYAYTENGVPKCVTQYLYDLRSTRWR
jgi:hypothetical protein